MANLFLISDTHFGHQGMCQFLREDGTKVRPFDCVSVMDQTMIENWNKLIKPKDKVYHLGDVVINRRFLEILKQLNGEKILIKGNHDIFKLNDYTPYFKDIRGSHRLDTSFILSHIPLHQDSLDNGKINLHGHIHHKRVLLGSKEIDPKYLNICVEHWDYKPVPFEIAKKVALEQV